MTTPLLSRFGIIRRSVKLVEMYRHDELPTVGYQFWGANNIDDAYGDPVGSGVGGSGPDAMFEVVKGRSFRSPGLKRKGLGFYENNRRGQTTVIFDPEDYVTVGGVISPDSEWLFLRVQENRNGIGLLDYPDVAEATVTLAAVVATDQIIIKGIYFEFAAGANNLAHAGTVGDPFIVGLGAGDNDAAANLMAALNDDANVSPVLDLVATLNIHTVATNPGAPSAVVVIGAEDGTPTPVPGSTGAFTVTTPDAPRVALDAATLAAGAMVYAADPTNPVMGPIYCVPPAIIYGQADPAVTFGGTVPLGTNCVVQQVPAFNDDLADASPRPLHIVFPNPLQAMTLSNMGAGDMLFSLGKGVPMQPLVANSEISFFSGRTKEIILAATAATTFRVYGIMDLGT